MAARLGTLGLILLAPMSVAQSQAEPHTSPEAESNQQLQVNWLYGAYVPKEVPLKSLSNHQRLQLFLRQSFTTPGVYLKTAFFRYPIRPRTVPRNGATGSAAMRNGPLRATDNLSHKTPWRQQATACLGTNLVIIAASAPAFGRVRAMLLCAIS